MICKALVLGVERIVNKPGSEKTFDFYKVNFVDTENPSGSQQSMTLPKEPEKIAEYVPAFERNRMKMLTISVFQNGSYLNFGGFEAKA